MARYAKSGAAAGALVAASLLSLTLAAAAAPHWLQSHAPAIHAGLTALTGVAALLGAGVALARARRTGLDSELRLAAGIAIIAVSSVCLGLLPVAGAAPDGTVSSWLPVPARIVGACLLLSAARSGARRASQPQNLGLGWLAVLALAVVAALIGVGLGLGALIGQPAPLLLVSGVPIALYAAAAVGLAARAHLGADVTLWLYAGAALALAEARLVFWIEPAPGDAWVSSGDLVRVIAGILLVTAAYPELVERRAHRQQQAVETERERLAREIHDGLAQELAFIVGQTRRMAGRNPDNDSIRQLSMAAQNALTDARRTIFRMHSHGIRTLSGALVERTFQLSERAGLALDLEMQGDLSVEPAVEHEILRILAEAISNTSRHAHASHVSISIASEGGRVVLRIADDGEGFDPRALRRRRGFGLISMAQRAESLGGELHLESHPGTGTVIELAI